MGEAHLHHLEQLGAAGQVGRIAVARAERLERFGQAPRTGQGKSRDHRIRWSATGSPGAPAEAFRMAPIRLTLYPVTAKLSTI